MQEKLTCKNNLAGGARLPWKVWRLSLRDTTWNMVPDPATGWHTLDCVVFVVVIARKPGCQCQ
eukprot:4722659-Prymnesium_polylepis.1